LPLTSIAGERVDAARTLVARVNRVGQIAWLTTVGSAKKGHAGGGGFKSTYSRELEGATSD